MSQSLFALASHTAYWSSNDTLLFVLETVYATDNARQAADN